jgi:hypothetical protein
MWPQIKAFADDLVGEWGLILLVILLATASFALGRLSVLIEGKPLVAVTQASAVGATVPMQLGGQYVASRTGSVYYFPWCSGAQNIAPANQRWFQSEAAAQKAGYRPAKNCKGL